MFPLSHVSVLFLHRMAKIVRNSNRFSSPSTNIESKVGSSGINVESRTLVGSNGSTCPGSDIGVRAFSNNKDRPPPNSHDGADFMSDIRCSIPQNSGHDNGLTTPFGHNIGSTASSSNNSLAPLNSNAGMMLLADRQGSSPPNILASSLIPASSNILGRVLSITDSLSLPHLDVHMDLLGDTSGSNTQNFVSSNGSIGPPSSEIGTTAVSSNSSLAPSNSIIHSFSSQNYTGDISDSISCISNQENIFEDILNELLPPSSANSGTWQFTGKL